MGQIKGRFREARLDYQSRLKRVVTVEDIADTIGISRQAMSDIENNKTLPRYTTLAKLCALYGLQPGDLLTYDEDGRTRLLAVSEAPTNSRARYAQVGRVGARSAARLKYTPSAVSM